MDESKHKSHIESIEGLFSVYPNLRDFLVNTESKGYEEWGNYLSWITSQKIILQECLQKLRENYSYASIFPVIRELYENFWFIHLAMNGVKHYKYFKAKKGHDINAIYSRWLNEFQIAHAKGEMKDVLGIHLEGRIKITYLGARIKFEGKETNEIIPIYYFLFRDYNPIEAYVGKQKKIIEKYLTPPHLFNRFVLPNKNLSKDYFEFQHGIIPHLLLNNLITEKQKQRVIIHYNFLSLWSHPNKISFSETENNFDFRGNKTENPYMDRLVLLYIGHLAKMFMSSFLEFLKRQEKEKKISKPDESKLKEVIEKIDNFESISSYFWFIYNNPSRFYKYDYAIHKIWRKHMIQKNITRLNLSQIKDTDVPYYNNPLESLKKMSRGWSNTLLGHYIPEIEWK